MVRFNTTGTIDARNGGAFAAQSSVSFSAGATYHFRLDVNLTTHTYSIYVTPPDGAVATLGSNYAFRTEQAGVTALDTLNIDVNAAPGGSVTVSTPVVKTATKFAIAGAAVTASANDGNLPANTVDGSLATRCSALGDPQWIQFDLGATKNISAVKIAFYSGDVRVSNFDLQVSTNGTTCTTVLAGRTTVGPRSTSKPSICPIQRRATFAISATAIP